jgi:formylglycine-generating enzyme required for sulfatase activity
MARYAFFVGVNQYNDKNINPLKCAERDARRLASLFEHKLGFKASYLEERSAEDIEERITRLGEGLRPADTFVFYFAGHGKAVADEQYFLLPRANLGNLVNGTGRLSFRSLKALTSQPAWRGVSRVFIFDACRSAIESGARDGARPKFKGEAILRDATFATSASVDTPLVLINACSEDQCAIEVIGEDGEGHGVFSSALASEIAGGQLAIDDRLAPRLAAQMQHTLAEHGQERDQHPVVCGALPVVLGAPSTVPAGAVLDERLWQVMLTKVEAATTPLDKIALLESHMADPAITECRHVDEALRQIKQLSKEVAAARSATAAQAAVQAAPGEEADRLGEALAKAIEEKRIRAEQASTVAAQSATEQAGVQAAKSDTKMAKPKTKSKAPWLIGTTVVGIALAIWLAPQKKALPVAEIGSKPPGITNPVPAVQSSPAVVVAQYAVKQEFRAIAGDSATPLMVVMPSGQTFQMGSSQAEQKQYVAAGESRVWADRENPPHPVTIRYKLAVGKYAVTRGEFGQFVQATGYRSEAETDGGCWVWNSKSDGFEQSGDANWKNPGFEQTESHPVVCVSWNDAQAYVKWLNSKAGLRADSPNRYRLLSEAEWEYACRAGSTTAFWWGDQINTDQANYDGRTTYNKGQKGEYRRRTVAVDSFQPNPWGLYQMHGNVWEWVEDSWHGNYEGAPDDGRVWAADADTSWRVLRGGSWGDDPWALRSARRGNIRPFFRINGFGFRLARTLP